MPYTSEVRPIIMTPINAHKKIIVSEGGAIKIKEHFEKVTGRTRAGKNGKNIMCPHCQSIHKVYHFSFSALQCTKCYENVEKTEWLVDQLDTWRTPR